MNIIGFLCNWCSYESADGAGRASLTYPEDFKIVRVMCSGRIDPQHIAQAFALGANGVLVLGCRLGECHYKEGNRHALKRIGLLKQLLPYFGIDSRRLKCAWISANDHERLVELIQEMKKELLELEGSETGYEQEGINKAQEVVS